jgi:hypothetical protein
VARPPELHLAEHPDRGADLTPGCSSRTETVVRQKCRLQRVQLFRRS